MKRCVDCEHWMGQGGGMGECEAVAKEVAPDTERDPDDLYDFLMTGENFSCKFWKAEP